MEEVDDEDDYPRNVAPSKATRIIELGDSSDEEDCPPLAKAVDGDDEGNGDENSDFGGWFEDDVEEPEESAESELG